MSARRQVAGDEGTTLMELVVGMAIMTIFMAVFTSAVVTMFSSTNKTQAVVNSSTQLNLAFERLDTQVRYATLIDQQVVAPVWSVAFQTDGPTSTTCRRLVISPTVPSIVRNNIVVNDLVERTWTMNVDADGSLSAPGSVTQTVLATGIALVVDQNNPTVPPFEVSTPALGTPQDPQQQLHQQLRLRLVAVDGNGHSLTKSSSEITFSALNSATPTAARSSGTSASVCAQTETP